MALNVSIKETLCKQAISIATYSQTELTMMERTHRRVVESKNDCAATCWLSSTAFEDASKETDHVIHAIRVLADDGHPWHQKRWSLRLGCIGDVRNVNTGCRSLCNHLQVRVETSFQSSSFSQVGACRFWVEEK